MRSKTSALEVKEKNLKNFSPLIFLSSLGAGGIAVSFFALINYTVEHGKGLIDIKKTHALVSGPMEWVFLSLETLMGVFILIHIYLTVKYFLRLIEWIKTDAYKEMIVNPLANSAILAPFISITMTMNVMIGSVRYLFPFLAENLQSMMLPGLIVWAIIWVLLLRMEIKLLKTSFVKGFDVSKINFGWLLHPFALGMVTVTGAGIAALSKDPAIAGLAFFMLMVSGTMGAFLFLVKAVSLFKSHFAKEGLPEKQFLPSLLIVVPNITLYAISLFRVGHYLEHHQGAHLVSFFTVVMTVAFAFQTWYMLFGLSLLKDYFKKHLKNEFHVSQWGLVCPFVAYAVMSSFVYALLWQNIIFFWFNIVVIAISIVLFFFLLKKQNICEKGSKSNMICG